MERDSLVKIATQWQQLTYTVLDLKRIPMTQLQVVITETYRSLSFYCNDTLVPKEISKILLEMDSFLYFTSMMEEKEVGINFYHYQLIHRISEALKNGFFSGNFRYNFPRLELYDEKTNSYVVDLENDIIEDFVTESNLRI